MWIQCYGECLCPLIFKLQFILGKIMQRICIPSKSAHQGSQRNLPRDQLAAASRTTSLTDKAVQFATSETYVFSDSVLRMGGISQNPVKAWKEKIDLFMDSRQYRELDRIVGEPMEFEWWNFPGFTTLQILAEILKLWWLKWSVNLSNSKDELSSCQCVTTLYGKNKETEKLVLRILLWLQIMLENSRKDIGRFLSQDQKRSGTELTHTNQMENGTMSLSSWWSISVKADMPFFEDPVLLKDELWRAKEKENCLYISMAATKPSKWFFI